MHSTSLEAMTEFTERYLPKKANITVLDIGSCDLHGNYNYRKIFVDRGCSYIGVDLELGENVDILMEKNKIFVNDCSFDVVVSGQTLEHVDNLHSFIIEAARVLKCGGLMCMIAPTSYPYHAHPIDCWRIFPDGMSFLMRDVAGLEILESKIRIGDCVGIARKIKGEDA